MPSWITSALKKNKNSSRKRGLTVRFVDMSVDDKAPTRTDSQPVLDTNDALLASPLTPGGRSRSDESLSDDSSCGDHSEHTEIDEEERRSLRHLDDLGHALENTFKEVESIDAYVGRLRFDFDHDRVTEHRYMTCICSAKIARAACCKRQLEAWRELQHGMQEIFCHYCHHDPPTHKQHNVKVTPADTAELGMSKDGAVPDSPTGTSPTTSSGTSPSHHEDEVMEVLEHLRRMTMFDLIVKRLNPGGNQRSFVQQWVIHGSP